MNIGHPNSEVKVSTILKRLSTLIETCSAEVNNLEKTICAWLHDGASPANFPIVELQSMDRLHQVQSDVATLLASRELWSSADQRDLRIDETKIAGLAKLGHVRAVVLNVTDTSLRQHYDTIAKDDSISVDDVDLF